MDRHLRGWRPWLQWRLSAASLVVAVTAHALPTLTEQELPDTARISGTIEGAAPAESVQVDSMGPPLTGAQPSATAPDGNDIRWWKKWRPLLGDIANFIVIIGGVGGIFIAVQRRWTAKRRRAIPTRHEQKVYAALVTARKHVKRRDVEALRTLVLALDEVWRNTDSPYLDTVRRDWLGIRHRASHAESPRRDRPGDLATNTWTEIAQMIDRSLDYLREHLKVADA